MRMRCRARHRSSREWKANAYPITRGLCASVGGSKKACDLSEATTLDDGHAKEEPCFAPHRCDSRIWACFVVNIATE